MKPSYIDHLANQEYTLASELWYDSEHRLKLCVENGDEAGALEAVSDLTAAVVKRFGPLLTAAELSGTLFGIVGGILHFACRDAGLSPACLTMMILCQKDLMTESLSAPSPGREDASIRSCVLYACELVNSFSLPACGSLIRRCITLIQQRLTEQVTVALLSEALGVTRQHLSAQFHKETGKTIPEYINFERVKLSKYYLRQRQFTVTQIAFMCGYSDSNYFGRAFKRITGQTPSEYRRGQHIGAGHGYG